MNQTRIAAAIWRAFGFVRPHHTFGAMCVYFGGGVSRGRWMSLGVRP